MTHYDLYHSMKNDEDKMRKHVICPLMSLELEPNEKGILFVFPDIPIEVVKIIFDTDCAKALVIDPSAYDRLTYIQIGMYYEAVMFEKTEVRLINRIICMPAMKIQIEVKNVSDKKVMVNGQVMGYEV